jgi:hypothetical protein
MKYLIDTNVMSESLAAIGACMLGMRRFGRKTDT